MVRVTSTFVWIIGSYIYTINTRTRQYLLTMYWDQHINFVWNISLLSLSLFLLTKDKIEFFFWLTHLISSLLSRSFFYFIIVQTKPLYTQYTRSLSQQSFVSNIFRVSHMKSAHLFYRLLLVFFKWSTHRCNWWRWWEWHRLCIILFRI